MPAGIFSRGYTEMSSREMHAGVHESPRRRARRVLDRRRRARARTGPRSSTPRRPPTGARRRRRWRRRGSASAATCAPSRTSTSSSRLDSVIVTPGSISQNRPIRTAGPIVTMPSAIFSASVLPVEVSRIASDSGAIHTCRSGSNGGPSSRSTDSKLPCSTSTIVSRKSPHVAEVADPADGVHVHGMPVADEPRQQVLAEVQPVLAELRRCRGWPASSRSALGLHQVEAGVRHAAAAVRNSSSVPRGSVRAARRAWASRRTR